ncbi:MAG TPA: hypothetical protein VF422_11665 [Dokdonella sp.]
MAGWLESAWLARYLDRQLEGEELAWFEGYLLDKPELMKMIEVDNALRDAVASGAASFSERAPGPMDGGSLDAVAHLPRMRATSRFVLAAAVALGLGIGWYGKELPKRDLGLAGVVPNPTRIVFDTMRGAADAPTFEHKDSGSKYILVDVAVPPRAKHVQLLVGDEAPTSLVLSADGFVSFLVDRSVGSTPKAVKVRYMLDGRSIDRVLTMKSGWTEEAP